MDEQAQPEADDSPAEAPSPEATPEPEGEAPREPRKPRLTRRRLMGMIAGGMVCGAAYKLMFVPKPAPLKEQVLSKAAQELIAKAWTGIDPAKVIDIHVHVLGLGKGTDCYVHDDANSFGSPVRYFKTRVYKGAAGIYDDDQADALFVERLVDVVTHQEPRGRFLLMAFDEHRNVKGEVVKESTEFHTPNDYVFELVAKHPKLFLACASVHPYRADALDELKRCKDRGAVAIKWLPNAMGMDPADPRCDAYYELLAKLKLTLISHAGNEQAVHAEEAQELGNPLRLRRPLDMGVKVVVAHCASLGTSQDLDAPADAAGRHPAVDSYTLFRRLLEEPKYLDRVYGGLSATTQVNRCVEPLTETIVSTGIHPRLVNGSDYPLPAIDPLISTWYLEELGYITGDEREVINEIYDYNPLTFDFVLKRTLKVQRDGVTHRLPASAFETAHLFA